MFLKPIDLEKIKKYEKLDLDALQLVIEKIVDLFNDFLLINDPNLTESDIDINVNNLQETIERTNKRTYYYAVFHNINISEIKQCAILCFWFVKLKPFTVLKENSELRNDVNEVFSVFCLLALIKEIVKEQNRKYIKLDDNCIKDMVYAFKYQDITKEAMIIYFEAIATSSGVDISKGNNLK